MAWIGASVKVVLSNGTILKFPAVVSAEIANGCLSLYREDGTVVAAFLHFAGYWSDDEKWELVVDGGAR
jgi:hypothetical protein